MNTKLTLRLEEDLIGIAKRYAADQGRSVSDLVASYFKRLESAPDAQRYGTSPGKQNIPPQNAAMQAVQRKSSFYGLIRMQPGQEDTQPDTQGDTRGAYRRHLAQKHQ